MKYDVPKYEIMQAVKSLLVRHAVDLSKLNFSVSQTTLYLSGELKRSPSGEFDHFRVEALLKDLEDMPYQLTLIVDLDDWDIQDNYGSWTVQVKRKSKTPIKYV